MSKNKRIIFYLFFFLLTFLFCTVFIKAEAANLYISPVKVALSVKKPVAVFEITNNSLEPIPLHIYPKNKRWRTVLAINPPIVSVASNKTKIVQIALIDPSIQKKNNLRIYVEEIPIKKPSIKEKSDRVKIQYLLRFSIPVIIE